MWRNERRTRSAARARGRVLAAVSLVVAFVFPVEQGWPDEREALDYMAEAHRAINADDYAEATRRLTKAKAAARRAKSVAVLREIEATQKWLTTLRRKWKELQRTRARLESNPTDKAAHWKMGAFYCFAKEDWKRGIPHLAKGSDSELRQLAQLELKRPSDGAARFGLGKKWLEAADAARG